MESERSGLTIAGKRVEVELEEEVEGFKAIG